MNDRETDIRQVRREVLLFALGTLVCLGLMYGVYALLHRLTAKVLLGGAVGAALAILNYVLTAAGVLRAADKAEQGDAKSGMRTINLSMLGRYLLMILVLVVFAKSGLCDVIAMVIPLLLSRLVLFFIELFRRKDG